LKWAVYGSFAPHFVALEKGLYSKERLTVAIEPGGPGLDPIKLVASGADDIGLASYDQVLLAREKGIPIVAIAEDTTKSGVGFLSLASAGITKPSDFVGRKVGIMPGTDKGTVYEALMAKLGIDRSRIEEIPVAFDLNLLLNGTVEVFPSFITNQPIVAEQKGFQVSIVDPYEYGIRPGGNVYFVTETTLKTKRDVLKRFLKAELRAILLSQSLPSDEAVDIVMKHNNKLERDTEIKIWEATIPVLLQNDPAKVGLMSQATWQHTADLFQQSGLLKIRPDLAECYTNAIVEELHAEGAFADFSQGETERHEENNAG
jgi:ABC-type nitrate/sulfonate/bicarbonate transport system substrate-binding protein